MFFRRLMYTFAKMNSPFSVIWEIHKTMFRLLTFAILLNYYREQFIELVAAFDTYSHFTPSTTDQTNRKLPMHVLAMNHFL